MADIGDVYNVLTGQEVLNEFIIRRNRSSSTIYLTSPARDPIVKVSHYPTKFSLSCVLIAGLDN